MRRTARALLAAIAAAAAIPLSRGASASPSDALLAAVNVTRGEAGVPVLREDAALDAIALDHSAQMSEAGRIFHNIQLGPQADARGIAWTRLGENVGAGADVDQIERALVASPHHYENLVDPRYTLIGIAVVSGSDRRVYLTQVFATVAPPAPVPAARPVVRIRVDAPIQAPPHATPQPPVTTGLMRTEDGHYVPEIFYSAPPLRDDGWLGSEVPARSGLSQVLLVGVRDARNDAQDT